MKRAPFIAIESCDGGGSTTQCKLLVARCQTHFWPPSDPPRIEVWPKRVYLTAQPSDGPIGKFIRAHLRADVLDARIDPEAFQRLFVADRVDHLARTVEPARAEYDAVICDRSELSTAIYYAAGLPVEDESDAMINAFSWHEGIEAPTLTVILVVSAWVAEARRVARGGPAELFERAEFQARVAGLYEAEATRDVYERGIAWHRRRDEDPRAGRPLIASVDGAGTPEEVHARVWTIVEELLR